MILLVRHGQTAANAAGLPVAGVRRVVTSPLHRARETAEAFGLGVPVEVDDRWTELDYGAFEGRPFSEVPSATWQRWRGDASYTPPGGESLAVLGRRVRAACEDLAGDGANGDVAVVSHVSPIKAAIVWALGVDDTVAWRMFLDVASISRLAIGAQGPSLRSYNETHHLSSL
ncbi:MAG: histidine phosphatase family protein [Actinobacteria bacterium]|nr:MAG: histidine phosphatase family protein [Actinomycetota bacterium]